MMQIFVVSNVESRRTAYFIKAGKSLGADIRFLTYDELLHCLPDLQEAVIKLEPFVYDESGFLGYDVLCADAREVLERLGRMEKPDGVRFLNHPDAILRALDKVRCKEALMAAGIRTTPMVGAGVATFEELQESMAHCPRGVFLKPRYGSGAEGIMAIRYNPGQKQWVAYTTLSRVGGDVHNTKRIHRLTDVKEIAALAGVVLQTGAVVEEWIAKDTFEGENYDLRVVCREGEVDYVVVRRSSGAITNLHLNNKAGSFDALMLPPTVRDEIFALSVAATRTLGLSYAGVDVLLEKGSRRPYVIEVNGQGDHIYQDMFDRNLIYTRQIASILATKEHG